MGVSRSLKWSFIEYYEIGQLINVEERFPNTENMR